MASDKITELTEDNFESEVTTSEIPYLVDFWAEWCGPCKMIAPVLEQIAEEVEGQAKIGKVNIDDHGALATKFGINSIPTLLIFSGGQIKDTIVGAGHSPQDIKNKLLS